MISRYRAHLLLELFRTSDSDFEAVVGSAPKALPIFLMSPKTLLLYLVTLGLALAALEEPGFRDPPVRNFPLLTFFLFPCCRTFPDGNLSELSRCLFRILRVGTAGMKVERMLLSSGKTWLNFFTPSTIERIRCLIGYRVET